MTLHEIINLLNAQVLSWPVLLYILGVCIACTLACNLIQFRYFFKAWSYVLWPEKTTKSTIKADMTPFQAFLSSLSTGLGNGSIAGMATAIYSGGPGAAFWVLILGFIIMAVRYAEVFLSTYFGNHAPNNTKIGGPMLYLRSVLGGRILVALYAGFGLFFSFIIGNGMQTNSIRISIARTWGISPLIIAIALLFFIMYVVFGGAPRIIRVSDKLVPIKVITFFASAFMVLAYHYQSLLPSLHLIIISAFTPTAAIGGLMGFSVQQAMRFGIIRSIAASEAGLGTTAILFAGSSSQEPVKSGIMSMLSAFMSTIVCFMTALCIIASGVWSSGEMSTALTISAFNTVFGQFGGWVVSFLSVTFGMGVMVAYAYITREFWLYLTNGRYEFLFTLIYCTVSFAAALIDADLIWKFGDLVNAGMLIINLFGIIWLLPIIRKETKKFIAEN